MASLKSKFLMTALTGLFFLSFAPSNAQQTAPVCQIPHLRSATVVKVDKDGFLQLKSGDLVRLIGIKTVKLIDNPDRFITKKLNALAKQTLEILRTRLEGKIIELHQKGRARDRYDRLLAHVYDENGKWLQGTLLRKGLARSFSYQDNRICMKEMLALEATARREKRGLWHYRIFQPQPASGEKQLLRKRYRFTLVEGKIRKVAVVKKWVFLNFGDNWRDDFTIAIKRKYKRKMQRAGLQLEKLEGRRVRVRGWIERWNGPLIKVTHKEQIELLEEE